MGGANTHLSSRSSSSVVTVNLTPKETSSSPFHSTPFEYERPKDPVV